MLQTRYDAAYDPVTECVITVGVSEGLDLALRVLLNPGDEVIVPEPCYVSYIPCIEFAGGRAVTVPCDAADGFRIHADRIEAAITPRTKALLIGSPANPTGATQSRADLEKLVALADRHDIYLISDEIYDRLTYKGEHTCMGALPGARERTIVLNGFSKAYAMTGWRIGYAVAPRPIAELMLRVHQYTMLCAPHIAQVAAVEALTHAEADVADMIADYDRRRRFFVDGLNRIGLTCVEPKGAFYAFPSIAITGLRSEEFAERLLMEERVAVVPGTAFGPSGTGYIRCSYATAMRSLEEALERMAVLWNAAGRPRLRKASGHALEKNISCADSAALLCCAAFGAGRPHRACADGLHARPGNVPAGRCAEPLPARRKSGVVSVCFAATDRNRVQPG